MAVGSDGSDEGKKHLKKIMLDDHKDKRAWSESSGAMAAISKKMGVPTLPSSRAEELTGKKVTITSPTSYKRLIGGHEHEKELMGHPGKDWK